MRKLAVLVVAGCFLMLSPSSLRAQEDVEALKQRIAELEKRVEFLEKQQLDRDQREALLTEDGMLPDDPFEEIEKMRTEINRLFEAGFSGNAAGNYEMLLNDQFNIKEEEKGYTITVDIPGMTQDSIHVSAEGDVLVISGERESHTEENSPEGYRKEVSKEQFSRALPLPEDADPQSLVVNYQDNVLTVTLQKKAAVSIKE